MIHTYGFQHLVALIENKHFAVAESEVLITHKRIQSTGCGDNDVRMSLLILQNFSILHHGSSSVEYSGLNIRHVLAEASVFILDLICQLSGVTHNKDRCLAGDGLNLLQSCEDEYSGLTET